MEKTRENTGNSGFWQINGSFAAKIYKMIVFDHEES